MNLTPLTTLADIMSRNVRSVPGDTTLQSAAEMMARERISSLVVEENGIGLGIITEVNILRAVHEQQPNDTPLRQIMSSPLITAPPTLDLISARALVESRHIHHLVVVDTAGKSIGMVSETNFRLAIGGAVFRHLGTLEGLMERNIPQLPPTASVATGIAHMLKHRVDYLIISDGELPLGILTERDIPRLLSHHPSPERMPIAQAMSAPLLSISLDESVTTALELMSEHHLRHLAVLDDLGRLSGVISQHRLFEQLTLHQLESALYTAAQERLNWRLETHLQQALQAANAGIWEYHHDIDSYEITQGGATLLGYPTSPGPQSRPHWQALIHPEDLPILNATTIESTAGPRVHSPKTAKNEKTDDSILEYRMRHQDGRWIWVEDRRFVIERHPDGRAKITTGILTDISTRRQKEAALKRQNRTLRLMSEISRVISQAISQATIQQTSEAQLLQAICQTLVEVGGFQIASISPADTSVKQGAPQVLAVFPQAAMMRPTPQAVLPLFVENQAFGTLNLVASEGEGEGEMLKNICTELGLGISHLRSRQALAESEASLIAAQRIARIGHYHFSPANNFWTSSPVLDDIFGLDASIDHTAEGWMSLIHPEDRERMGRYLAEEIIARKQPFDNVYRIVRPRDGELRWVHGKGDLTLTASGEVAHIFGTIQDISESKQLERRLLESNAALQEAQAILQLGNWRQNLETGLLSSSDETKKILGLQMREAGLTQAEFIDLVHPDDRALVSETWQGILADQAERDFEFRIVVAGYTHWVRGRARVQYDGSGKPCTIIGTLQDITERYEAETQVRKLTLAIEQSPHSIVITDTKGSIEYVNEAFTAHSGYSREEVVGQNPKVLHSGLTPAAVYASLWETLGRKEVWRGEFTNRRKDGRVYEEFAIISPVRQRNGDVTNYLAIKEDITEKKATESELEQYRQELESLVAKRTAELHHAKEEAESANRAKSDFLANMSHEIRTPMNAIMGLTHIAIRDSANQNQRDRLTKVADAAQHLLLIINDILDISKIEAGKLSLEETNFPIEPLLHKAIQLISDKAAAKQLRITQQIDPALPAALRGDPLRIQQILVNYLSNAVKFTDHGEIKISVTLLNTAGDTRLIRFAVQDTGMGLSDEIKTRLFKPFEQADSSTTRRHGGTGLGLAISRRLAEAMHGETGVDSAPGGGSTFWFTARLGLASATPNHLPLAGDELVQFLPGIEVLLVEDNPINEEVASDMLHEAGLRVDCARNGQEAVNKASTKHYALVLMDMQMPVMDGLEATRQIRQLAGWEDIPIIAMTANVFADDRNNCREAGMNSHVAKPVNPSILLTELAKWLPTAKPLTVAEAAPVALSDEEQIKGLSCIPGLDSTAGLLSVRGRIASYSRMLGKFVSNHGGDFLQIRQAIASENHLEARRLAHSLKGSAGALGVVGVQTRAAALEAAIQAKSALSELTLLINQTEQTYQEVSARIAETLGLALACPQLLTELRQHLKTGDIKAQNLLRQQREGIRSLLGDRFNRFEQMISSFDFEPALALLDEAEKAG